MARLWLLLLLLPTSFSASPAVLHISFHAGCIQEIKGVGQALGWQLTSWNPLSCPQSLYRFLGTQNEHPMAVYNMTRERATRVWEANRHYFESFDLIITSDTAPLSRIFLQHDFQRPLIIWVCNRFNYCVGPGSRNGMDQEYYALFREAMKKPQVKVIAYTPFEHYFAALYGVDIRGPVIKPIGIQAGGVASSVPAEIDKKNTVFIWPGFAGCKSYELDYIKQRCSCLGFATYCGQYSGPDDLKDFKGVIYFPYQASNLALFENIQRGIVHFVPSERFVQELVKDGAPIYYWHEPYYCEWYFGVHREIIVYFDSWADLAQKVANTDYELMREKIGSFGAYHRQQMLSAWQQAVQEILAPLQ